MANVSKYQFPQVASPITTGEKGITTLHHPEVGTFRFRSNPKEFNWSYTLNKRVDQTYGGRVIQLLGTRIDDFSFKADCGRGRWDYMNQVALFMRNVMVKQRHGRPATFEYTTRGWKFNAFIVSVPFADAVEEVVREFEIQMKVQEDVSKLMSKNTLAAELRRLQDGIGFRRNKYNDPMYAENMGQISDSEIFNNNLQMADQVAQATTILTENFLPNGLLNDVTSASQILSTITNFGKQ